MSSPTARTLDWLRKAGYLADVAEKWIEVTKQRKDLFGFIDVVAIGGGEQGVLAVQSTSASNHASRVTKILGIAAARTWIEAGNRIMVQSWKQPGGPKTRWECRVEQITIGMFEEPEAVVEPAGSSLFTEDDDV